MVDTPDDKVIVDVEADASQVAAAAQKTKQEFESFLQTLGKVETQINRMFGSKLPAQLKQLQNVISSVQNLQAPAAELARPARQAAQAVGLGGQLRGQLRAQVLATIKDSGLAQELAINKELAKAQNNRLDLYRRIRAAGQGDTLFTSQAYVEYLRQLGDAPKKGTAAYREWMRTTEKELGEFNKRIAAEEATSNQKRAANRLAATQSTLKQERALEQQHQREIERLFRKDMAAVMSGATPAERAALARSSIQGLQDYAGRRGLATPDASRLSGIYNDAENARQIRESIREREAAARDATRAEQQATREQERRARAELRERQRRQERRSPQGMAQRLAARAELALDYGAMGLGAAVVGSSAANAVELQRSLKQLQAISGATAGEMEVLQRTVFAVGNSTNFTNAQVAETATVLAQAGFSARQVKDALPAVAQLATATGASLDDAAQAVTSILTVFNMSADQTSAVANKLASALNSSKLDFTQLSLGIQYAANTSADAGLTFEEMTAALGAMSNAGIKSGSTLGTGLRNVIESLENPSEKFVGYLSKMGLTAEDVDVKSVGLSQALKTLNENGFSATDALEAFGQRAGSAYAALVPNLATLDALQTSMLDSAAASQGAATQMDSFSAQMTRASNATAQFVLVAGGPTLSALQTMAGGYADVTTAALQATPVVQAFFTVGSSAAAAGTVVWVANLARGLVGVRLEALAAALAAGSMSTAFTAANVALGPVGWTVIGLTAAFTGLTYIIGGSSNQLNNLQREVDAYKTKANEAQAESTKYGSRVQELTDTIERLTNQHSRLSEQVNGASKEADLARRKFGDWGLSLDGVGGNVDRLISKLVKLRGEMARAAADQARLNLQSLQQERGAAVKEGQARQRQLFLSGVDAILPFDRNLSERSRQIIAKLAKGEASSSDIEYLRPELQRYLQRNPRSGSVKKLLEGLSGLGAGQVAQIDAQMVAARQAVSSTTIQANPATTGAADRVKNYVNYFTNEKAAIAKVKDPTQKQQRYLALQAWAVENMPKVEGILNDAASANLKLPDVAGSGMNATQVRQTIAELIPGYSQLRMASRPADLGNDEKAVNGRLKAAQEELKLAQAAGKNRGLNQAERDQANSQAEKLQDEVKRLKRQKILLQNKDEDPLVVQDLLNSADREQDASFDRSSLPRGGGGRGDRAASQTAKTLAAQIKDLERKITIAAGQLTADQATSPEGRQGVAALIDQRNNLVRQRIQEEGRGSGASDAEIKDRLDAAQSEMDEFKRKVVEGTIEDALSLLATLANEATEKDATQAQNTLRSGRGDLDLSLGVIEEAYSDALAADLAVIAQKYRVNPNDRRQAKDEADAKARNLKARIDAAIETIEAYVEGQTRAIEKILLEKTQELEVRQSSLDRTKTTLDRFGFDAIAGGALDKTQRRIDRDKLGAQISANRGLLATKEADITGIQSLLNTTSDPASQRALSDKLKAAQDAAASLRSELAKSVVEYESLNREAYTFTDLTNAARATMQYQRDTGTGSFRAAALEQLPDTFGKVSASFEQMIDRISTASGSGKAIITSFAASVLDTLRQMAVKIAAQKILLYVLSLFGKGAGGGDADMSALLANGSYQGGKVRRFQGGPAARRIEGGGNPNRDSTWTWTQPGEWVISKSAVSMIGEDRLSALNSRGNRRFTEMASQGSSQTEGSKPTVLNVYVVSPDQQPSMGPNDVLAVITNDMIKGGATKKLVKQIVSGGV